MSTIYQIKATIKGSKPPIWRRFLVSDNVSLHTLHEILQVLFQWEDYHLHRFEHNKKEYGIPDPEDIDFGIVVIDERKILLSEVLKKEGERLDYWYDFGDNWHQDVVIEKITPNHASLNHPICIAGKRAAPPEDVGGVFGYEYFLETINDPEHMEHEEKLEWIGGEFDPEAFDIDAVNEELEQIKFEAKEKVQS